jgi:hypothetical protein
LTNALSAPLTAAADPRREIPAGAGSRLDRIETALATLAAEERRLARLGLELPIARCHQERRYWTFLRALFAMPGEPPAGLDPLQPEGRIR